MVIVNIFLYKKLSTTGEDETCCALCIGAEDATLIQTWQSCFVK